MYSQQTGGEEVDEEAATNPIEESGRVVLDAEHRLRERRPTAVILRFAGIYGPGRLIRAREVRSGEPIIGDPDKWLNLIHVQDGATAVVAAGERAAAGAIYNVCDNRPARRREFYTLLAAVLGAPAPRFVAPPAVEPGNRRLVNRRMREELGVALAFPSFEEGIPDAARTL